MPEATAEPKVEGGSGNGKQSKPRQWQEEGTQYIAAGLHLASRRREACVGQRSLGASCTQPMVDRVLFFLEASKSGARSRKE